MEALGSKNISIHSLKGNLRGSQVMPEPSLPDYVTIYVTIINIIIFVVGVVGNVLVIVVVAKVKDMRTNINLYLVNLSVADLLVLLVCQPTAMLEFYAKERWYLGAFVCKLIPVLEHTVLHASTLTIVVISLERYHAICRSLTKFLRCSRPKPLVVLMCIWTIAFLFSFPFLLMTTLKDALFFDGTPCKLCSTEVNRMWHYCFLLLTTAIFFVLPLFLLAALYSNIIRTLYRSDIIEGRVSVNLKDATGYSLRSRRQVIRMLIALIILFFISLAPLRIVIIWQVFSPSESVVDLGIESYYNLIWLCRMMMYLNSAGNPLIYSLLSCKFKIAFSSSYVAKVTCWIGGVDKDLTHCAFEIPTEIHTWYLSSVQSAMDPTTKVLFRADIPTQILAKYSQNRLLPCFLKTRLSTLKTITDLVIRTARRSER